MPPNSEKRSWHPSSWPTKYQNNNNKTQPAASHHPPDRKSPSMSTYLNEPAHPLVERLLILVYASVQKPCTSQEIVIKRMKKKRKKQVQRHAPASLQVALRRKFKGLRPPPDVRFRRNVNGGFFSILLFFGFGFHSLFPFQMLFSEFLTTLGWFPCLAGIAKACKRSNIESAGPAGLDKSVNRNPWNGQERKACSHIAFSNW